MNIKKILKLLKYNESTISMILGIFVILIVGLFIIKNYRKQNEGEIIPSIGTEKEETLSNQNYIVQKGDDLWKISEKLLSTGYDWKKIADANNLNEPYIIEEGQELIIPTIIPISKIPVASITPKPDDKFSTTPTITTTNDKVISGNSYEVVKGDNLWNIAVRSYGDGYKWVEIARANDLKNPDIIHAGNVFVIPR